MNASNQVLLTFLFNACWQILLIAAVASLCGWLIRGTAVRYQHWLCVAVLLLLFGLPVLSSWRLIRQDFGAGAGSTTAIVTVPVINQVMTRSPIEAEAPAFIDTSSPLSLSKNLAATLVAIYLSFLCYRFGRLAAAWLRTRKLARSTYPIDLPDHAALIVRQCQAALGVSRVRITGSDSVTVPVTLGIFHPQVVLPEKLLAETDHDVLRSAVGHELAHVRRRDYLLNLIYEIIYLPLSFHPAAALVRRRIIQTRELACDALVAEKLLDPQAYARSLVRLIGSAAPFGRPSMTVGIGDADILEVRIMSLLDKSGLKSGRSKWMVIVAAMVLIVPCVAATTFAVHLKVNREGARVQEPSPEQSEKLARQKREREEVQARQAREREIEELKSKLANENNPEARAKLEAMVKEAEDNVKRGWAVTSQGGNRVFLVADLAGQEKEEQEKKAEQAELLKRARISMDQAIQIAVSQQPGKAIETSLMGEHWEAPGKLAKDGVVLYRVTILSGDETNPTTHDVLVNAESGSIWRVNKEERRRAEATIYEGHRPIEGGVLNGKAKTLPLPAYPEVARTAQVGGSVEVRITIDEEGNVVEARAVSGHPLLQPAAVSAARAAKFTSTRLNGEPVRVNGTLVYNFVVQ
jgi:TonB family protein